MSGGRLGSLQRNPSNTDIQRLLWQALFSCPWDWWDNRRDKRSPAHPDFRYKKSSGEGLWLDDPDRPHWVDSKLAGLFEWLDDWRMYPPRHAQTQIQGSDAELRSLCEQGCLSRIDPTTSLSRDAYITLLKACGKAKSITQVKAVHSHLLQQKLRVSGLLGDHLVAAFAKSGALEDARCILFSLSHRTVYAWTAVIAGYVTWGYARDALEMHRYMQEDGVEPNEYTFVSLFKACASISDVSTGKNLHGDAHEKGFTSHLLVANALISMYGKCGSITKAEIVFDGLSSSDVVSWTAMLTTYVELDQGEKALQFYRQMQEEGVSPDQQTFVVVLQACGILIQKDKAMAERGQSTKVISLIIGQALHLDAQKEGLSSDVFLSNTLVNLYGKCGSIVEAENVFIGLSRRDLVSWNSMLTAYVEQEQVEKTVMLYRQMLDEGVDSDPQTFVVTLNACYSLVLKEDSLNEETESSKAVFLEIARSLHATALKKGLLSNSFVCNSLVSLYGRCGSTAEAENVFQVLQKLDIVSWSAMLSAYVEKGEGKKALHLYKQMQDEGTLPDQQSFVIAIQACVCSQGEKEAALEAAQEMFLEIGQALHLDVSNKFCSDMFVCNALVSMYGQYGRVVEAETIFLGSEKHYTVSWNAMLTVYLDHNQGEKALELFVQMEEKGVPLNDTTVMCVVEACRLMGNMEICRRSHFIIVSAGYDQDPFIRNTLLRAYGSCASMVDAQKVFEEFCYYDLVSWNSCISSYAQEGNSLASLEMFDEMQSAGVLPDAVTFLSVLTACSHAGLVYRGTQYFISMTRDYGITPIAKHYGVMTDLLARAGEFKKVELMLAETTLQGDLVFWLCLLGACRTHNNLQLGKQAFDRAVGLKPNDPAAYVLMSNMFTDAYE